MKYEWADTRRVESTAFDCGYCGAHTAPNQGYEGIFTLNFHDREPIHLYICSLCGKPTFIHRRMQVPRPRPGNDVANLPDDVASPYQEARDAIGAGASTAGVMMCRKVLMNVAVDKGAKEGLRFVEYIDWFAANGYEPPNGRDWIDRIRTIGNDATHKSPEIDHAKATAALEFTEWLLRFAYTLPGLANGD